MFRNDKHIAIPSTDLAYNVLGLLRCDSEWTGINADIGPTRAEQVSWLIVIIAVVYVQNSETCTC